MTGRQKGNATRSGSCHAALASGPNIASRLQWRSGVFLSSSSGNAARNSSKSTISGPGGRCVAHQAHPAPGHGVVVERAMAVVQREPAYACRHHLLRGASAVPADGQPGQAQMIAVPELRVGQGQAEEGVQELIVWSKLANSPEKEMTPLVRFAGSDPCLAAGVRSIARSLRGHSQP